MRPLLGSLALLVAGCGRVQSLAGPQVSPPTCRGSSAGFAADPISDAVGAPTALAAVRQWEQAPPPAQSWHPSAGSWHLVSRGKDWAKFYSGSTVLHVIRMGNRTWFVDSGQQCLD